MSLTQQLTEYVRACFTALWVQSHEHTDALLEIQRLCRDQQWQLAVWDIDQGLRMLAPAAASLPQANDPLAVLKTPLGAGEGSPPAILVLTNFHRFLNSPEVIQTLHRRIHEGRQQQTVFLVLSPVVQLPTELEKLFTVITHELPGREQLAEIARGVATESGELPGGHELDQLLEAAGGLTRLEAENAFSLSLVREGRLQPATIWERKLESLNRGGLLTVSRGGGSFDQLGGLEALKSFALRSMLAPERSGLSPRGVMLLGCPGVGKSAWCRALGNETGRPTVVLEMGGLMNSLVGQSERNLNQALATIDAMGRCVVFLDEVEKALAGTAASGRTDSGVTARLFGKLLSWMEERSGSYVVASANDISALPPEFTRSGRFDAVFFLDLPDEQQRNGIWPLYLRKYRLDATQSLPDDRQWTGAEIESCCRLAALLDLPLIEAARNVVPVASTAAEKIQALREWATGRCLDAGKGGLYQHQPSKDNPSSRRRVARPSDN